MQDLQEVTQEVHYENYRSDRLAKGIKKPGLSKEQDNLIASQNSAQIISNDKDRILLEKEAELRRMQEMLAQMQAKIQAQQ